MSRYRSHNWLKEFGGGYCIIYETFEPGALVTNDKKGAPVFARIEIVSEPDPQNPLSLKRVPRIHRLGLLDGDKEAQELQAFIDGLIKEKEDQAVWALQTVKEAGEGYAEA